MQAKFVVERVRLADPDTAELRYIAVVSPGGMRIPMAGRVVRVDGRWKVTPRHVPCAHGEQRRHPRRFVAAARNLTFELSARRSGLPRWTRMEHAVATVRPPNRQPFTLVVDRRVELGREADGVVVVDSRVSRRHVALEPGPGGSVIVTDLGSSNGTTLDGHPRAAIRRKPARDRSSRSATRASRSVSLGPATRTAAAHGVGGRAAHDALVDRSRRGRGRRRLERARPRCRRRARHVDGRLQ